MTTEMSTRKGQVLEVLDGSTYLLDHLKFKVSGSPTKSQMRDNLQVERI